MTNASAAPDGPVPDTFTGNKALPPVQLLRIRKRTTAAGVEVAAVLELPAPVDPPSGNAGFGIPLGLNLNLKFMYVI